jgi:hypothetical protein
MKVLLPVVFDNYRNRKDGSAGLSFTTQELTTDQVVQLHGLMNSYGVMYFKAGEKLLKSELEELDAIDIELNDGKSQSQRIRNAIFRIWEQSGKVGEFKEFYRVTTEKIINHLISKLK